MTMVSGAVFPPLSAPRLRCSVPASRDTRPIALGAGGPPGRAAGGRGLAAVVIVFLAGCQPPAADIRPLDVRSYTVPRTASNSAVPRDRDPAPPGGLKLEYDLPEGWVDGGAGGLRLATLRAGDDAEITVIQASGTMESNVSRWQGQLTPAVDPDRVSRAINAGEKVAVNGVEATILELDDGATERPQAILAAVVPLDESNSLFVKFKGAAETARRLREPFTAFVRSLRWQ
jgi:hypothetical protein